MAVVRIAVEIPNWTVRELQEHVHSLDEFDSGPGDGIAPENVTAMDVIEQVVLGELDIFNPQVLEQELTDT